MFRFLAALLTLLCLTAVGPAASRGEIPPAASSNPVVSVPTTPAAGQPSPSTVPLFNQYVLKQIRTMPTMGGYAVTHAANVNLMGAVRLDPASGLLAVDPSNAHPSYCSGATYLVFLKTVAALRAAGQLSGVDGRALEALLIHGQRDGEGIWGRWNANGPGTARLFRELRLGSNFTRIENAQPGDFMKVFWTEAVGKKEHGHSVIFMGRSLGPDGSEFVRFWSSNQGMGYGEKLVPRAKISHAIFSRLEQPENLRGAANLAPATDPYLASLLTKESSAGEAREKCGAP